MNKMEEREEIKSLNHAIANYLVTPGINELEKRGKAKEQFDEVVEACGKCWDVLRTGRLTPKEKKDFFDALVKEMKYITK